MGCICHYVSSVCSLRAALQWDFYSSLLRKMHRAHSVFPVVKPIFERRTLSALMQVLTPRGDARPSLYMMCACKKKKIEKKKGARSQNRGSFVCMSRGLPQRMHWGSSLTQPGDCITHNISELLKREKPLIRNSFKGGHLLYAWTQSVHSNKMFSRLWILYGFCTYGAPRRFDDIDVFSI